MQPVLPSVLLGEVDQGRAACNTAFDFFIALTPPGLN
jgi:hypothetical protein